jgi:uncharacterized protein
MKRLLYKMLICLPVFLLAAGNLCAQSRPSASVAGEWLGALDLGAAKLRLALRIEVKDDGSLTAVLDSVDQQAKIPVDTTVLEGSKLRLELKGISGSYEGTLSSDGKTLEGKWSQGGQAMPLTFSRQERAFALNRPQEPKAPFPYASREVTFQSPAGGVWLAGTLILPPGEGPFPAVALASGSGPQDRDETLMGHKPFLVIADALARRGIASLRWDDRGVGASTGDHMGSTLEDFAADSRAAVAFLRSLSKVDRSAVGIVGHSEGGLTASMVAAVDESVAFLVLLAPPGEPLRSLLMRQSRASLELQGIDGNLLDRALASQAEDLALVADPSLSVDQLETKLRTLAKSRMQRLSHEERTRLGATSAAIERRIQIAKTAWFRSLIWKDPAKYLRHVKVPVLALFGDKDFQVNARVNAEAVGAALAAAGNSGGEVRTLSGLNHLFQRAGSGGPEEYGTIDETFSPEVLATIGDWIAARFAKQTR